MDVYWLEQSEANLPLGDDWLSPSESARLSTMRIAKRRNDWRLGRWTAKNALAYYLKVPADPRVLASIEILPASSGAPEVFFEGQPAAATISLSHRGGMAACAVARSSGVLGCDLELIEPRSEAFVSDYFTAEEQSFVAAASVLDRSQLLALLWSAKESALKALRTGLRLDTRSVIVGPLDALRCHAEDERESSGDQASTIRLPDGFDTWRPLRVCRAEGQTFFGWWVRTRNVIRTLVAIPSPEQPIPLA